MAMTRAVLIVATDPNQKRRKEDLPVYEQGENLENPLRCPVKLYEFYLSKWSVVFAIDSLLFTS